MDQHVARLQVRSPERAEKRFFSALHSFSIVSLLVLAVSTLPGCSRERSADHVSASRASGSLSPLSLIKSAAVDPNPILRDMPIEATIDVDESVGEELNYEYQWYVNRVAVHGATSESFDSTNLRRGDVVHVEIIGSNDKGERASYHTAKATVANAPPVVQKVVLEQDLPNRRLLAKVQASDADQDDIHFLFRWLRNEKVVSEGPKEVFDAADLAEKDIVTVEVVPHDHDGPGEPVRATPLVASNNAPHIVSHPNMMGNAELYEYAVEAKDPEGDAVVFELETGPSGMAIDKASGRVTWKVPPSLKGTHHVKIVAADAKGARSWQEFDLSIPASPAG
jgi:putative Ig domain-containing protein